MKYGKKDKGVAGLTVLLSVITSLFVIGLLIMIFALMSGELADETDGRNSTTTIVNETLASMDTAGEDFAVVALDEVTCTLVVVANATSGTIIGSDNYTQTNCHIANSTLNFGGFDWNVTYTYDYTIPTTASSVITNTSRTISSTTTWFPIIIVITAMVVLILLVVIIITAIRGSGLIGGGQGGQGGQGEQGMNKGRNIGSA